MAQAGNKTAELLNGPVLKTLLGFAAPMFLANFCQTAFNIIDMIIVGQWVGSTGLSGVSVGTDIVHFLLFFGMGLCTAGQVLISQFLGGGNVKRTRVFIGTFFTFILLFSSALTIISLLACPWALDVMNTPAEAYEEAYVYTMICIAGMPIGYLYTALASVMRAHGDSKNPLYFVLVASVLHVALALVFMIYLNMGVTGAALSSVIGMASSLVLSLVFLHRFQEGYNFVWKRSMFVIDQKCLKSLLKLGIPMALQSAAINISRIFVNSYVNSYGLTVSAATGVAARVVSISQLYSGAIGSSTAVMTGYALGAHNTRRVYHIVSVALVVGLVCSLLCLSFAVLAPEMVFGFFTSDAAVLAVCMEYVVPFLVLDFIFSGLRCGFYGMINGSARPMLNYAVALLDGIIGRIGLAILFGMVLEMGYQGFWLGNTLAGCAPSIVGLAYLLYTLHKRKTQSASE